jgi:hypothetical protein
MLLPAMSWFMKRTFMPSASNSVAASACGKNLSAIDECLSKSALNIEI